VNLYLLSDCFILVCLHGGFVEGELLSLDVSESAQVAVLLIESLLQSHLHRVQLADVVLKGLLCVVREGRRGKRGRGAWGQERERRWRIRLWDRG
jgi:hypothetical protein